jgi:hypothetical protein
MSRYRTLENHLCGCPTLVAFCAIGGGDFDFRTMWIIPSRLREKSVSQSISVTQSTLGGAALQRCDNGLVLNGGFSR